ncbi:MAG: hypothetical protein FWE64_04235 [Alphaproteobacteria bacterium]|nr:hypothetical protein [Alphaproteobacteria bacterium]
MIKTRNLILAGMLFAAFATTSARAQRPRCDCTPEQNAVTCISTGGDGGRQLCSPENCKPGFGLRTANARNCTPCGTNQISENNRCRNCPANEFSQDNQCSNPCADMNRDGMTAGWNSTNRLCSIRCANVNHVLVREPNGAALRCEPCPNGTIHNDVCRPCGEGATVAQNRQGRNICVCPDGRRWDAESNECHNTRGQDRRATAEEQRQQTEALTQAAEEARTAFQAIITQLGNAN